jgi:hypothetical protein
LTSPAALQRVAALLRAQIRPSLADALVAAEILEQLALAPLTHKQRKAARAALFCTIAERFYVGAQPWTAACAIDKGLSAYTTRCWQRRDEYLQQNPAPSTIQGYFWEILRLIDEPVGDRTIYRDLKENRD